MGSIRGKGVRDLQGQITQLNDELTEIEEGFEIHPPFLLRPIVEYMHNDERLRRHNKCQSYLLHKKNALR